MRILCGIDAGQNSVGLATVIVDEAGMPVQVPHILTVKHDGGKDQAASGQTASVSRKASGGNARRSRRRRHNRRRQRRLLREKLSKLGLPVVDMSHLDKYEAWEARIELTTSFVEDAARRSQLISIAIQHMERHRGWANAWLSVQHYLKAEEPSDDFLAAVRHLEEDRDFRIPIEQRLEFQADIAALGLTNRERLRPRNPKRSSPQSVTTHNLLGRQRREDVAREWKHICELQRLPESVFQELGILAFQQEHPRVPEELIGRDWVPGYQHLPRASTCSMEYQEFRIRQEVANLGVKETPTGRTARALSIDDQLAIVDTLMGITSVAEQPTWREIAETIGVQPQLLVHNQPGEQLSAKAPINRSLTAIHSLPKRHPVMQWWLQAPSPLRSAFVLRIGDASAQLDNDREREIDTLLASLTDDETAKLESVKLDSGRTAHCLDVLRLINDAMAKSGERYTVARNRIFNDGRDMRPPGVSLREPSQHPTLQRVIPPVRRFLLGVEREHGAIDQVTIEHVRTAFLGFHALEEVKSEQRTNTRQRARAREHYIQATNDSNPRQNNVRKLQLIERQGSSCLYCGTTLSKKLHDSEIDHIVPRAGGGSNRQANLAAVCVPCNSAKGRLPFLVFAESGKRPGVSLEEALSRVQNLTHLDDLPLARRRALKREMTQRLKQTTEDEPVDERSLASTAYAAVELRSRIQTDFGDQVQVPVYRGSIVSAARKASGIDDKVRFREEQSGKKSRLDRRHHAIDAAVAAMITPSVAQVLAIRESRRAEAGLKNCDDKHWKDWFGEPGSVQEENFQKWLVSMKKLAELIVEKMSTEEIPVTQSVRLSSRHARLHEETRVRHSKKRLGDKWVREDLRRVVDRTVYRQFVALFGVEDILPPDPERRIRLSSGKLLSADDEIYLFPDTAARIALPNSSSAELGATAHHARLYRIPGKKGVEMLRVWAADLYELPDLTGADLLTQPVEPLSAAVRRSSRESLRRALANETAELLGSFAVGDEVRLSPTLWKDDTGKIGQFMRRFHETQWEVVGLYEDTKVTLKPRTISAEGLDPEQDKDVLKWVRSGIVFGVTKLFARGAEVVRRDSLGRRREAECWSV